MRKKILAIAALLITTSMLAQSCKGSREGGDGFTVYNDGTTTAIRSASSRNQSGDPSALKVVRKTIDVKNFHGIRSSNFMRIIYTQGNSYKVTFEGWKAHYDNLSCKVVNGLLVISTKRSSEVHSDGYVQPKLYVTAPTLDCLRLNGADEVYAARIKAGRMDIDVSGAARIDVKQLDCGTLTLKNSGHLTYSGKIKADAVDMTINGVTNNHLDISAGRFDMKINGATNDVLSFSGGTASLKCNGAGSAKINLNCKSISVDNSGVVEITLSGKADKVDLTGAGVSNINQNKLNKF